MKQISYFIAVILLTAGCVKGPERNDHHLMGVNALLWTQLSAEAEALYIQGYNIAGEIIRNINMADYNLPPAVVLDIDETVLDNSPFNVNMLREGFTYSEEKWAEWCERREATPLPGAIDFLNLADSLGIEIYYISNRMENLMKATIDNLVSYGFPRADSNHLLLKSNTSSKDERRAEIASKFDIVLLLGDNLGDFAGIFDSRTEEFGKTNVQAYSGHFGSKFILFPNPVYGTWERAIFAGGTHSAEELIGLMKGY
jgi:5'-nucleotidase (lipoprotein e(P4) family)